MADERSLRDACGTFVDRRVSTSTKGNRLGYLAVDMPRFLLWSILCALLCVACGDDDMVADGGPDAAPDAAVDGGPDAVDVGLPEGPRGDVLRIEELTRTTIEGLEEEVYVVRTEANVPHIYAQNEHDLRVVQGYVVAADRYFQIEAGRRLAQGRLSELIGDGALAGDLGARGRGMTKIAERLVGLLTPEQEEVVDAYVLGVNAYIQNVKDGDLEPPSELALVGPLLGGEPGDFMEPLTRADLIAFAAVPVYQLGFETGDPVYGDIEERIGELFEDDALRRAGVDEDLFRPVQPIHNVSSAPGFGYAEGTPPAALRFRSGRGLGPLRTPMPVERSMLDRLLARNDAFEDRFRGGRWNDFGSNAWATSAAIGDGATILSGDGHLPLSIAPFFYQMGLDTTVFGEGATSLMGLFFAAIPPMAVGTNGRIAWSQTYLRGDVTDWYAEELILEDGAPVASRFRGSEEPLIVVAESVDVANIDALMSVGRTETWDRYETFDGRILAAVEGRPALIDTVPGAGEALINVQGDFVIPDDVDGDGIISGVSFDYTGFDVSNILHALQGFNDADNVHEFRDATAELVSYAQNLVAADTEGNVYYGSYNATPSRAHLSREADGSWSPGANPRGLLDGTQYGGFEVRLDENGMPDESSCGEAPETCLVPFDRWPSSINPSEGFVLTANHDIANITTDNDFTNDEFYLGGPWNNGFRGETIRTRLTELGADSAVNEEEMARLQGNHTSVMGRLFAPMLLEAIAEAQRLEGAGAAGPDETRLLATYTAEKAAIDEVETRLRDWIDGGAEAASGVETFYNSPEAGAREDAVATMIFNQWWREHIAAIFADEDIDFVFAPDRRTMITRAVLRLWRGRGAGNPEGLASWDSVTRESVFFDRIGTPAVERSFDTALDALVTTLAKLRAEPGEDDEAGVGGFGTTDMSEWLWGLRHQVKFESIVTDFVGSGGTFGIIAQGFAITTNRLPLMADLPDTDVRASLTWFPRPGDLFNVDAGHTSFSPDASYFFGNGPVMRMVIRLEDGNITGRNIIPGGQSGLTASDYFDDQAERWLANETVPLRFHVADVVEGAIGRETFAPAE